jgi:hypothetical protein
LETIAFPRASFWKNKIDVRPRRQAAAIIGQVRQIENGGLRAN